MILLSPEKRQTTRQKNDMKKGAILSSVIKILNDILSSDKKANLTVRNYLRRNKFVGSKDRKLINNLVFKYLKNFYSLKKILKKNNLKFSIRSSLLVYYFNAFHKGNLEEVYDGKYSIKPEINDKVLFQIKENIFPSIPAWLREKNFLSFYKNNNDFYKSILLEARVDLRIDGGLYIKNEIIEKLKNNDIKASKCVYSSLGITLEKRIPENHFNKIKNNYFEIQDEGSQIMTMLIGARAGDKVLDYCAGRGTKTLALYNQISKRTGLYAYEINQIRLKFLLNRLKELKIMNISVVNSLELYENFFDIIVLDVPCSGTGIWRRKPEDLIRLNREKLERYKRNQKRILNNSVKYCKSNGIIVYITCSILEEENEEQIKDFLKVNKNFETINLKKTLKEKIKFNSIEDNMKWFTLMPNTLMTDGFFISIMRKKYV